MVEQPTNPDNQQVVWQLVVSHPYETVKVLIGYLETKCDRFVVSEHEADEDINRTHCHFSLVNYKHSKVALTKEINKYWNGSDNFGILTTRPKGKGPYDAYELNKYVGKGRQDAFDRGGYSFGYSRDDIRKFVEGYKGDREIESDREGTIGTSQKGKERLITKIQYKLKVESPTQQKLRKDEQVKICIQRIKELEQKKERQLDDYEIRDIVREMLVEWGETVGIYKALDLYDTVLMRNKPNRWNQMFDDMLQKRKPR